MTETAAKKDLTKNQWLEKNKTVKQKFLILEFEAFFSADRQNLC